MLLDRGEGGAAFAVLERARGAAELAHREERAALVEEANCCDFESLRHRIDGSALDGMTNRLQDTDGLRPSNGEDFVVATT